MAKIFQFGGGEGGSNNKEKTCGYCTNTLNEDGTCPICDSEESEMSESDKW